MFARAHRGIPTRSAIGFEQRPAVDDVEPYSSRMSPTPEIDRRPGTLIISHAAPRVDHVGGASGRR